MGGSSQREERSGQLRVLQLITIRDGTKGCVLIPSPKFCLSCCLVASTLLCQSFVNTRFMHTASPSPYLKKALNIYIIAGPKIKSINGSGCSSLMFTGCHKNGSVQIGSHCL